MTAFRKKIFALVTVAALLSSWVGLPLAENLESNSFKIEGFGVSSGTDIAESDGGNYQMATSLGQPGNDDRFSSTSYSMGTGIANEIMANVPGIGCFEATGTTTICAGWTGAEQECGEGSCYDRARFEIDPQNNPTDALYSVQIREVGTNAWYYIDGSTNLLETEASHDINDYLTKASWETPIFNVLGLLYGVSYELRASALNGDFTESGYGATASATTALPSLIVDLDVSDIGSETDGPYSISMGTLSTSGVTTGLDLLWLDLGTNAQSGMNVYIQGQNDGLLSDSSYLIASNTENLAVQSEGYGVQVSSVAEASLGPLTIASPFNGVGENVGGVSITPLAIFNTTSEPISGGRASVSMKAKIKADTPAGKYTDQLTFTLLGSY